MTASAANGFGQVKYAPNPSTTCKNIPYNFHPMYATSTSQTTVPWAAATYNVAFDTEIGHFDYCSSVDATTGTCAGNEGIKSNTEVWDYDDVGCWPGSSSGLIKIGACEGSNVGYDGTAYLADWPNATSSRPTPFIFTSPLTGSAYNANYSSVGFNTDLPAIEGSLGTCNNTTGAGCTIIPPTDDGAPAQFYPSVLHDRHGTWWVRVDCRSELPRVQYQGFRCAPAVWAAAEGRLLGAWWRCLVFVQRLPEQPGGQSLPSLT